MLSHNVKKLRKIHNLSQEQLAYKSGLTFSTLSKVESGINKNPTLYTVLKIANTFKVSIYELIGRKNI